MYVTDLRTPNSLTVFWCLLMCSNSKMPHIHTYMSVHPYVCGKKDINVHKCWRYGQKQRIKKKRRITKAQMANNILASAVHTHICIQYR